MEFVYTPEEGEILDTSTDGILLPEVPTFYTFDRYTNRGRPTPRDDFPQAHIIRLFCNKNYVNLVVTNQSSALDQDYDPTSLCIIKGNFFTYNCDFPTQQYLVSRMGDIYYIFKRCFINLLNHYKKNDIDIKLCTQLGPALKDADEEEKDAKGYGPPSWSSPTFFPIDQETLTNYKYSHIRPLGISYNVAETADPLLLMLSCFSTRPEFVNAYLNYVTTHKNELLTSASQYVSTGRKVKILIPEDVCISVATLIFLSIAKSAFPSCHWLAYSSKRLQALRCTYGKVSGFNVWVPFRVANSITEKVKALPHFQKFLYRFLTEENVYSDSKLRKHLVVLCQYKGLIYYKMICDLLDRGVTLAHYKYINPVELQEFMQARKRLMSIPNINVPLLFFQSPENIPIQSKFAKLGTFAIAVSAIDQPVMEKIKAQHRKRYPDLELLLATPFSEMNMTSIAKSFKIPYENVDQINRILQANNVGTIHKNKFNQPTNPPIQPINLGASTS